MFSINQMERADLLTLLAIIIALSAYLATVRLFMIDRLTQLKERKTQLEEDSAKRTTQIEENPAKRTTQIEENSKKTKSTRRGLLALLLADVPMTVSAVLLGIYI